MTATTSLPYTFDAHILREYDIRGIVGKNLNEKDAWYIGAVFGTIVKRSGGSRVCVGYDGRLTSPALADALINGLTSAGMNVDQIGVCPTPMLYFSVKDTMSDGGIMITGSHNPPEYNGFKMMLQSRSFFGEDIITLGKMASAGDIDITDNGTVRAVDHEEAYIKRLLRDVTVTKPMKIAWDVGNGSSGDVLHSLVAKLPGEHILLFDEIDGTFPNHHPDPTVDENLADLKKLVLEQECDIGIAFDGDGDRIGVVDDLGNVLRCDSLIALYAAEILEMRPGAPIVADVKCSQALFDTIEKAGGVPVMWKTGHSLMKSKMSELKAPLAGELSGHIFFADKYYGFDDALYAALRLIDIVAQSEEPLSKLTADAAKRKSTPEIRIDVDESKKFDLVTALSQELRTKAEANGWAVNDIDGIRVVTDEGWFLTRASNTQNCLVARAESETNDGLERTLKILGDALDANGLALPEKF